MERSEGNIVGDIFINYVELHDDYQHKATDLEEK